MGNGIQYNSGRELLIGFGSVVQTPIEDLLPAAEYKGALVFGSDDNLHYSDGNSWVVPDRPPISQPISVKPKTAQEYRRLTLLSMVSSSGFTQTGIFFEVTLDSTFQTGIRTINVDTQAFPPNDIRLRSYELSDTFGTVPATNGQYIPFGPNQVFYWRAKYVTSSGDSPMSKPLEQTFPNYVDKPEALTRTAVDAAKVSISPFSSAFANSVSGSQLSLNKSIWQFSLTSDFTSPIEVEVLDGTRDEFSILNYTSLVEDVFYFWRARYVAVGSDESGIIRYSEWTDVQTIKRPLKDFTMLIRINLEDPTQPYGNGQFIVTLSTQDTYLIKCLIDWGDGTPVSLVTTSTTEYRSHVYTKSGDYVVSIRQQDTGGKLFGVTLYSETDTNSSKKLIAVKSFGRLLNIAVLSTFAKNATNLESVPYYFPPSIGLISELFNGASKFNQPLDLWDVSNVISAGGLFANTIFNQDIGNWNVANMYEMNSMFENAINFNCDLSRWNPISAYNLSYMFRGASSFNSNLTNFDTTSVLFIEGMFAGATVFNGDISKFNVSLVTSFFNLFNGATKFNQSIATWDTSRVTNMVYMFKNASSFNQPVTTQVVFDTGGNPLYTSWDVSKVNNMDGMFEGALVFNQALSSWKLKSIANTPVMFRNARAFNQDLTAWENPDPTISTMGNVTRMDGMFTNAVEFDGDISNWKTGKVTQMQSMFENSGGSIPPSKFGTKNRLAKLSGLPEINSIKNWDVSKVTRTFNMFLRCKQFDQDLSTWNVALLLDANNMFAYCDVFNSPVFQIKAGCLNTSVMFAGATLFNQPLTSWDTSTVTRMNSMFSLCASFNQPLNHFVTTNVTDMYDMFYRASAFNQNLNTWNVSNVINMWRMFCAATAFNGDVSTWRPLKINFGGTEFAQTGSVSSMFVSCSYFNQNLENWNMPDCMSYVGMFAGATSFNCGSSTIGLNNWDMSKALYLSDMFRSCAYNKPLNSWVTTNVVNMTRMFYACPFNKDIGTWDVSNVVIMYQMFYASPFNFPIGNWNVGKVYNMAGMFYNNPVFNQDLSAWRPLSNYVEGTNKLILNDMFRGAVFFNSPVQDWFTRLPGDTRSPVLESATRMFNGAIRFNQNVSYWDVTNLVDATGMFGKASAFSVANFELLLNGWKPTAVVGNKRVVLDVATNPVAGTDDACLLALENFKTATGVADKQWIINTGVIV